MFNNYLLYLLKVSTCMNCSTLIFFSQLNGNSRNLPIILSPFFGGWVGGVVGGGGGCRLSGLCMGPQN